MEWTSKAKGAQNQEVVIKQACENLGFTAEGHPLSAIVLYKALLHWKAFQTENTNTFDQIIEMIRISTQGQQTDVLYYWMSNISMIYSLIDFDYKTEKCESTKKRFFGVRSSFSSQDNEKVDALAFKQKLTRNIQRIFVTIRDKIKLELQDVIEKSNPVDSLEGVCGSSGTNSSLNFVHRSSSYWRGIIKCLASFFDTMKQNHVPHSFAFFLISEVLKFINIKLFNSLLLPNKWFPYTYSNAKALDDGLTNLDAWIHSLSSFFDESFGFDPLELKYQLRHIQEATLFMLSESKHNKTMEDFCELCPHLNKIQLAYLCAWFEDDVHNSEKVDDSVVEEIWNNKEGSEFILLHEEDRSMFMVEDALYRMKPFDIDQFDPPSLTINSNFECLLSPTPSPRFKN